MFESFLFSPKLIFCRNMLHFHLQRGLIFNVVPWHLDTPVSEIMGIVCTKICLLCAFAAPCCTIQLRLHHCHKHNFKHLPGAAPCRDQDRAEELCFSAITFSGNGGTGNVKNTTQLTWSQRYKLRYEAARMLSESLASEYRHQVCMTGSYFTCLRPSLLFCMILRA